MVETAAIGSICCLVQADWQVEVVAEVEEVVAEVEVVEEVAIGVAAAIIPTIGMALEGHPYPMMQVCWGLQIVVAEVGKTQTCLGLQIVAAEV